MAGDKRLRVASEPVAMLGWMTLALTVAEWTSLGGVALAFLAAAASWASVRQGARIWRTSLLPQLHGQTLAVSTGGVPKAIHLVVYNSGGGLSKGTGFVLASSTHWAEGYVGTGFMRPGQEATVETTMPIPPKGEDPRGILICRDRSEISHAWNLSGEAKRLTGFMRRREVSRGAGTGREVLARFYPAIDVDRLTKTASWTRPESDGG